MTFGSFITSLVHYTSVDIREHGCFGVYFGDLIVCYG